MKTPNKYQGKTHRFCLLIVIVIFALLLGGATYLFHRISVNDKTSIKEDLFKNREIVFAVRDYFISLNYDDISIFSNGNIVASSELVSGNVTIKDISLKELLNKLFARGYSDTYKTNSCVVFERNKSFIIGDFEKGVVYTIDGHIPNENSIQFLTYIEAITEDGWYYYEADYNKHRSQETVDNVSK